MIRKIKEWSAFILGSEEGFSLQNRLFLSTIIIGIFVSLLGAIVSTIISSSLETIIIATSLFFLLVIFYYFVRVKGLFTPFIIPLISISFVGISLIWIFDGGINGADLFIGFVIYILALIIVPEKSRKYVISLFITLIIIIYLIQYYKPELITKFPSENARWTDSIITVIYSSFFIFLIMKFVLKNYTIEKNRAEENEIKFRALSENSQDHITRFDRHHHIIYMNKAGINATGRTSDQLLGKSYSEAGIYSDLQTEIFEKTIENVITTRQPQYKQYNLETGNGLTYYDWRLFPEFNEKNEVLSVLGVTHDITVLKQAEIKLLLLNADKDLFISILAHDLRNPFNTILGFSGLMIEELRNSDLDTIEKQLQIIHTTSQKTYDLLEDLLLWAKSQSGKLNAIPKRIDFGKICSESIEMIKPNALSKDIKIDFTLSGIIFLWADESMVKIVIRNLLSNAIKFTNPGGNIHISTQQSDLFLTVSVSDDGVGIPSEVADKLFEISQRVTTTGTSNEKGTGLGLLLCKEFVEKNGGKIRVESITGKGSDFIFTLPVFTGQSNDLRS